MPEDFCAETGQSPWCTPYLGGPWCIDMWNYATYVQRHGCNKLAIKLEATDVAGINNKTIDSIDGSGFDLMNAKRCLESQRKYQLTEGLDAAVVFSLKS